MSEGVNEWTKKRMNEGAHEREKKELKKKRINEWMSGWMNEWMNEWMRVVIDFVINWHYSYVSMFSFIPYSVNPLPG